MEMVPDATVEVLRLIIAAETGVEPENQRALTFKGAKQDRLRDGAASIDAAGVRPGTAIKMVGTSTRQQEVFAEKAAVEARRAAAQEAANKLEKKKGVKAAVHRFGAIRPLPASKVPTHGKTPQDAHDLLEQLASDPGIYAIMNK